MRILYYTKDPGVGKLKCLAQSVLEGRGQMFYGIVIRM